MFPTAQDRQEKSALRTHQGARRAKRRAQKIEDRVLQVFHRVVERAEEAERRHADTHAELRKVLP